MSKITVAGVRQNVQQLLKYSHEEKKRNFLETVEYATMPLLEPIRINDTAGFRLVSRTMTRSVISVSLAP